MTYIAVAGLCRVPEEENAVNPQFSKCVVCSLLAWVRQPEKKGTCFAHVTLYFIYLILLLGSSDSYFPWQIALSAGHIVKHNLATRTVYIAILTVYSSTLAKSMFIIFFN